MGEDHWAEADAKSLGVFLNGHDLGTDARRRDGARTTPSAVLFNARHGGGHLHAAPRPATGGGAGWRSSTPATRGWGTARPTRRAARCPWRRFRWSSSAVSSSVAPRATYRLQLHAGFTFADAAAARRLPRRPRGQPPLQLARAAGRARQHPRLRRRGPLAGERRARRRGRVRRPASAAARSAAMGLLLDIVPNHMAIVTPHNRWWWDVLENGTSAATPPTSTWTGTRRKPGCATSSCCPSSATTTAGCWSPASCRSTAAPTAFVVRYHEHAWPMSPALGRRRAGAARRSAASDELAFLAGAHERLDAVPHDDLAALRRRHRDKDVLQGARRAAVPRAARGGGGDRRGDRSASTANADASTASSSSRTTGSPSGAPPRATSGTAASST